MTDQQHLTFRQIEEYAGRRLPEEAIPAFHEHAENCPSCREMLKATIAASEAEHLSEQDAVDYVADLLPAEEKRRVAGHLANCPLCTAAVADLEEFRESDRLHPVGAAVVEMPVREMPVREMATPRRNTRIRMWLLPVAAAFVAVAGASLWFALRPTRSEPTVMASLRDASGVLQLGQSGIVSKSALPAGAADLIAAAMRSGHLPDGPVPLVSAAPETLRGSEENRTGPAMTILSPVGVRLISDRPEFRWQRQPGAASWQISVFDENFNEVARSPVIHGDAEQESPVWTPAAPLPRQRSLLWQVTEFRNGRRIIGPAPPVPSPRFEIVSDETARQIAQAQAVNPPSHLLLAILYSRAGLRREAIAETDAISNLNPGSALATSLRGSLGPGSLK